MKTKERKKSAINFIKRGAENKKFPKLKRENNKIINNKFVKYNKITIPLNSNVVLISMQNGDGWKFTCNDYEITIEKGIFLGNKNKLLENENIFISGIAKQNNLSINWTFEKIS